VRDDLTYRPPSLAGGDCNSLITADVRGSRLTAPAVVRDYKSRPTVLLIQIDTGGGIACGIAALGFALWLGPLGISNGAFPLLGTLGLISAALAIVRLIVRRNALPWLWRRRVIKGTWPGHPGPEYGEGAPMPSIIHWWNAYRLHLALRFAPLMGTLIILGGAYYLEGNPLSLAGGAALPFAFLADWPTRQRFEHWVRVRRAAVQRLRRREQAIS
jgi:hypothetical protein